MKEKITFRAEIEFHGSVEELAGVIERVREMPVKIFVDELRHPWPLPGLWPFPIMKVLSPEMLARYTKGRPMFSSKILDGIEGGIRETHLHLKDKVALIDREVFAEVMGKVADHIVKEIAVDSNYVNTIGVLRELKEFETFQ